VGFYRACQRHGDRLNEEVDPPRCPKGHDCYSWHVVDDAGHVAIPAIPRETVEQLRRANRAIERGRPLPSESDDFDPDEI
jgi:hypothetical protein